MTPTTPSPPPSREQLRSFGWLMGAVFTGIALWPVLWQGDAIRTWAAVVAVCFGVSGLVYPPALAPLQRLWMKVGEKLGWINSRIILGLMFFGIFTPVGKVMRVLGKRPLQLGYDPQAESYRVPKHGRDPKHVLKPF